MSAHSLQMDELWYNHNRTLKFNIFVKLEKIGMKMLKRWQDAFMARKKECQRIHQLPAGRPTGFGLRQFIGDVVTGK